MSFFIGFFASTLVALAAWRFHTLTRDGAIAAVFVGTAAIGGLQLAGGIVLLAFFLPSVALSRVERARKRTLLTDIDKQGPRDAVQVLANGGVAALCALLAARGIPHAPAAFAGAFAAAAADTWSTEIGTVFGGTPRSILTLKPIAPGLSGGVTIIGTLAEIGGALSVALVAGILGTAGIITVTLAGIGGATLDSLLGGSLQSLRFCPVCRRPCETLTHSCGNLTTLLRGLPFFGNDGVNLAATFAGALIAATFAP
ncbi:MAG TPA: DUF92 domain-containing protein [Candidatus Baltobacteraceae bacterium]|nr:DUF92 domain-containing protein [Candidatus Baltobacteraceae bacterium]